MNNVIKYSVRQLTGLLIIISLLFIESVDANIINIAIPQMAIDFYSNIFVMKLAVTSYIVGLSIFIPISGWFANRFGIKNTLIFSILIFILSSVGCAESTDLLYLIIYRFIQGVSGAFVFPISRLLMLRIFKKEQIVKVYTLITIPVLVGPIVAPIIGGLLISWKSWHYIFIVNIPLGFLILLATVIFIDNHKEKQPPFNVLNFMLLAIFIGCFSAYLDICLISYFNFYMKIYLLLISIFFGIIYCWKEKHSLNPVIKYDIFKIRTFKICFISTLIVRLALGARGFLISIFLQTTFHLSPLKASFLFIYMTTGFFVARPFIKKILFRFGFKKSLTLMNLCSSISLFMLGTVYYTGLYMNMCLFFNGFFASAQFMILNTMYYADIEQKDYSTAVSMASMWQQLSTAMGVVFVSNILYFLSSIKSEVPTDSFQMIFFILAIANCMTQIFINKLHQDDGKTLINAS